jgi:hypothetical protein
MFINVTEQKNRNIKYLKNDEYPESMRGKRDEQKNFTQMCKKFILEENSKLKFLKKTTTNKLEVFSYGKFDRKSKLLKIKTIHENGHFGRDRLMSILKDKIYGVKREEIMAVLNSCSRCQVRNFNDKSTRDQTNNCK